MMISTRGRYALRVLVDLAEQNQNEYIPMKDVAARQEISLKYLERILPVLTKNGYVEAVHGKGGGYRLTHAPEAYRVGDILRMTEGDLAPVSCLREDCAPCEKASSCRTHNMWVRFHETINQFFDGITLADLMQQSADERALL